MLLTLASYFHRIDPFAIQLSQDTGLRWYGLSYLTGFLAGYLVIRFAAKRNITPLQPARVADLVFAVALGTVVGGRLGYCVFYAPDRFVDFSSTTILGITIPFWGVLKVWDGGMASHGGFVGIIVAAMIFARYAKTPALHLLDLSASVGGLGVCFGRIANFINGELLGRPCKPDMPLAVRFPQEMTDWSADQLARLGPVIEQVGPENVGVNAQQWGQWVSEYHTKDTAFHGVQAVIDRFILLTQQRTPLGDQTVALLEPLITTRHPSQLYQAFGEGLGMFLILLLIWLVPRKPGVIAAWCLVVYAGFRIIGEHFRMPDDHIAHMEFARWGVTRGQLLSFAMIAVALVWLIYCTRRSAPKMGGWLKRSASD